MSESPNKYRHKVSQYVECTQISHCRERDPVKPSRENTCVRQFYKKSWLHQFNGFHLELVYRRTLLKPMKIQHLLEKPSSCPYDATPLIASSRYHVVVIHPRVLSSTINCVTIRYL